MGGKAIYLEVRPTNKRAIKAYEQCGFRKVKLIKHPKNKYLPKTLRMEFMQGKQKDKKEEGKKEKPENQITKTQIKTAFDCRLLFGKLYPTTVSHFFVGGSAPATAGAYVSRMRFVVL